MHIADGILFPPKQLTDRYNILVVDLGWEYGENCSIIGTPYACALSGIGGGTCAQSVIYVVASLLLWFQDKPRIDFPRIAVHGPGEVTAIALAATGARSLRLRGLRAWQIERYFASIGHSVQIEQRINPSGTITQDAKDYFALAVRAYLRSHIPAIVPVDGNALDEDKYGSSINHCVCITGIQNEIGEELILHDPFTEPFREKIFREDDSDKNMTVTSLWRAAHSKVDMPSGYSGVFTTIPEELAHIRNEENDRTPRSPGVWIVAAPKKIKLFLEVRHVTQHENNYLPDSPGLFTIAQLLQIENTFNREFETKYTRVSPSNRQQVHTNGECKLICLDPNNGSLLEELVKDKIVPESFFASPLIQKRWKQLLEKLPNRWVWMQPWACLEIDLEAVWIWNAEEASTVPQYWSDRTEKEQLIHSAERYILAVFEQH